MEKEARKKIGSLLIAGTILVSGIGLDKKVSTEIKEYIGTIDVKAENYNTEGVAVYINNERIEFDVEPSIINDRVMVPMRKIFESLGSTIEYNDETKIITGITEEGHKLEHQIGTNIIKIDNKTLEFDTKSLIKNDRTLVPIRFVGESLGADVYYWDEKLIYLRSGAPNKSVDIIKETDTLNNNKHAAIKESLRTNTSLIDSERSFFMNDLEPFYNDCAKYLDNKLVEKKKYLWVNYSDEANVEGTYGSNNITYYHVKTFEETIEKLGKDTCAHEYFHALQDESGYLVYNVYRNFGKILIEGGAAILEDEYFNGFSYNYEKNMFRLLCELLGKDVMGNFMIGGNHRIFCSELQKYLGNIEEVKEFFNKIETIEWDYDSNKVTSKEILDQFYNYVKKIYESKYEMPMENDRLMLCYLDYICKTNKLEITPINEGYDVRNLGIDEIYYFSSKNNNDYYKIWINEMKSKDTNTLYGGYRDLPISERYIDKGKVKKLTR